MGSAPYSSARTKQAVLSGTLANDVLGGVEAGGGREREVRRSRIIWQECPSTGHLPGTWFKDAVFLGRARVNAPLRKHAQDTDTWHSPCWESQPPTPIGG